MFLNRLNISTRLAIGFGIMIALLIVSATVSVTRLRSLGHSVDDLSTSRVPKLVASGRTVEVLLQSARQMRNVLLLDDKTQAKSESADVRRNAGLIKDLLGQIEKSLTNEVERNLFQAIVESRSQYEPNEAEFLSLVDRADYAGAKNVMIRKLGDAQSSYIDAISMLIEYEAAESQAAAHSSAAVTGQSQTIIFSVALLAILIGSFAAVLITRRLKAQLAEGIRLADAVAAGDLTVDLETSSDNEMGRLMAALVKMRESLADAVGTIRQSAERVHTASGQIAAGNAEISNRTEEQASTLEETAASMEELTTTVKQNADNAQRANELAAGASQIATRGGDAMRDVTATMGKISEASRKITDIIGAIDAIAFQTNILALNAAVEAARAGEHGHGFAVVASEVRALAHRSAAAAKEIKELIQNSVESVDGGLKLMESAGKTMDDIVAAVKVVTDIMSEIATASREQLSGIEQVGGAVMQMDRVVQQNSAVVEESAAAADNMRALAEQLNDAVARFRLNIAHQPRSSAAVYPMTPPGGKRSRAAAERAAPALARGRSGA